MNALTLQASRPLIVALERGIERHGILAILHDFGRRQTLPAAATARSWRDSLARGASWSAALQAALPPLHPTLVAILTLAIARGDLDRALRDVASLYETCDREDELTSRLAQLLAERRARPDDRCISPGCLLRELDKILRRARLEAATEILIAQEDEAFFRQTYLGVKPVHVREPSHAKVYVTLLETLRACAGQGRPLTVDNERWSVSAVGPQRFRLQSSQGTLKLQFAGCAPD